ncbi:MAG: hypothetical protein IT160_20190 [Bryobacterales bacterium]|nr:hypothetical protein [Bryobacterales bacterium]
MKQHRMIHFAVTVLAAIGLSGMPLAARTVQDSATSRCAGMKTAAATNAANGVFKEMARQSFALQDHASALANVSATEQLDYQFYDGQLNAMKREFNRIGREFPKVLNQTKETSAERRVAERLRPQLTGIATTITEAINFVNDNQDDVQAPALHNLTVTLASQTHALWRELHDAVQLASLHAESHQVSRNLARNEARS